ncbi:MAG TPA: Uma2 family endonuclease [Azospirillum sp.]|nr:Uma2 family endonuclease [Azospirillum sp.]
MAQPTVNGMTIDEFIAWADRDPDARYELVRGQPRAMTGGTNGHSQIIGNLYFELRHRLRPPRRVQLESGIVREDRNDRFHVADAVVTCSPQQPNQRFVENPVLVAEVLSDGTTQHDRGGKVPDYMQIPSVQEILLVDSRATRVQLWRRDGARWIVEDFMDTATLPLASVGVDIPLPALYEGVAF